VSSCGVSRDRLPWQHDLAQFLARGGVFLRPAASSCEGKNQGVIDAGMLRSWACLQAQLRRFVARVRALVPGLRASSSREGTRFAQGLVAGELFP
jgi:hypothetical protein